MKNNFIRMITTHYCHQCGNITVTHTDKINIVNTCTKCGNVTNSMKKYKKIFSIILLIFAFCVFGMMFEFGEEIAKMTITKIK